MAHAPELSDPRMSGEASVLPIVAAPHRGMPGWVIVVILTVLAVLLFFTLDARRRALTAPTVLARSGDAVSAPAPAPTLYIPPEPVPAYTPQILPETPLAPPARAIQQPPPPPAQVVYVPQQGPSQTPPGPPLPVRVTADPALVIDTTAKNLPEQSGSSGQASATASPQQVSVAGSRTGAGVIANPATTVPQGTLIPAVLETALDSTRPGLARAIVSRDVRGFDGRRILIPRGSRLIGEYSADVEHGQNRMLVNWIRLIRPDGATIAIGSPASDPLGQGGIKADVNSHFFRRFTDAFLQTTLGVGGNLLSRAADPSVVVALPGSLQAGGQGALMQNQIRPTLKVKAATSISVFVARDLDFTSVER